jgi:multisubunit Na+/H+ antiporter MnhG subunit
VWEWCAGLHGIIIVLLAVINVAVGHKNKSLEGREFCVCVAIVVATPQGTTTTIVSLRPG